MFSARRFIGLLSSVFVLATASCTSPDTISKFCGSASTTLASATPVFEDLKLSCLREVNSRSDFGTFTPPVEDDPNCKAIGDQAAGAEAAARILSEYFSAINALASFGTAKAGTDAQTLLSKTGAAVGASSAAQTALGSIAQFLVSAATTAYQKKQLSKDLPAASKNISAVIDALITILQDDYLKRSLGTEETKLALRYKDFGQNASPEVKLMLDDRWHADEQAIAAKRASAQNLISALQTLSKGTSDLAMNAQHLKAKELPGLLDPYVTQLQALVPQIQKGF